MEELVLGKSTTIKTYYENYADQLVAKYTLMKYPQYLKGWLFDPGDFSQDTEVHDIALFSMIIHGRDDEAIEGIKKYAEKNVYMTAAPLVYGSLDEFPIPSNNMINYLKNTSLHDPVWSYCVMGWCIMKGLDMKGLKFAKDHELLAKRINKSINIDSIKIFIHIDDEYIISFNDIGNQRIIYREHCLSEWKPSLDNACEMGCFLKDYYKHTYEWLRV